MAIRTLRRRVIIREYDYQKVCKEAFAPLSCMGIKDSLYDRAEFTPLDQLALEKIKLVELLKGKTNILTTLDVEIKNPALLLYNLKDFLYTDKYYTWEVTVDEDKFVCVQARKNTPKSRIGWAVFEKDIESRI
jgi:hypothetical protein